MASCSCGTRDKPKPVSPLSRGLWLLGCCMRLAFRNRADNSRCKALLVVMGLGRLSYIGRFLAGSNPSAWRRWLDFLNARSSRSMWDGGIPRPPAGGRAPLRRFAPCVLRWKTLRVSSAPHPCGFESLRLPTRKRPGLMKARGAQLPWLGRRDSNPQQPAPKTGVLPLNYVPVWVLPKATRLVYLICEGIANAIE